jgi:hypothetical protein
MPANTRPWRLILGSGVALIAVLMAAAVLEQTIAKDICMFILAPYFAALVAVYPVIALNRFGVGVLVYLPYVLVGVAPLYFFDYARDGVMVGAWAPFAFAASGLAIGLSLDAANWAARGLRSGRCAVLAGAVMQAVTFVVMALGFRYLYTLASPTAGHLHYFTRDWLFTLPWMALNGAFGGFTAYALWKRV